MTKMELSVGGQAIIWDSDQHPHWPPTDRDGKIIADLPWKFFDPPKITAAAASLREQQ